MSDTKRKVIAAVGKTQGTLYLGEITATGSDFVSAGEAGSVNLSYNSDHENQHPARLEVTSLHEARHVADRSTVLLETAREVCAYHDLLISGLRKLTYPQYITEVDSEKAQLLVEQSNYEMDYFEACAQFEVQKERRIEDICTEMPQVVNQLQAWIDGFNDLLTKARWVYAQVIELHTYEVHVEQEFPDAPGKGSTHSFEFLKELKDLINFMRHLSEEISGTFPEMRRFMEHYQKAFGEKATLKQQQDFLNALNVLLVEDCPAALQADPIMEYSMGPLVHLSRFLEMRADRNSMLLSSAPEDALREAKAMIDGAQGMGYPPLEIRIASLEFYAEERMLLIEEERRIPGIPEESVVFGSRIR